VTDPAAIADDRVAALAREILARHEYARFRPVDAAWIRDWLSWLQSLLDRLHLLSDTSPVLYVLLLLGLVSIAALLLAHVTLSVSAALRAVAPPPRARSSEPPAFEQDAARLAAAGQLLDAAHVMQLACLRRLLDRGTVELRRHDPNPVLRERVARADLPERERREFLALLDRLETRWFRDRAPSPGDRALFESWRALHERLVGLGRA
jgi:hypothetical protein